MKLEWTKEDERKWRMSKSMVMTNLEKLVLDHVRAVGPISFASIVSYVKEQYNGHAEMYEVSAALTYLIRIRLIAIYDDGTSFVADNS